MYVRAKNQLIVRRSTIFISNFALLFFSELLLAMLISLFQFITVDATSDNSRYLQYLYCKKNVKGTESG